MEGRIRVLAVDDTAINLAAIEHRLKEHYEVIPMNSGSRALHYLKSETPDIILLDIRMAEKDGIQTLKEIRAMKNGADVPVIMLTSLNDKSSIVESQKLGIVDYVLKPFDAKDLHHRIQKVLERANGDS